MLRIVITGATGVIGRALVAALQERGDQVIALSRNPDRAQSTLGGGVEVHAWSEPTRSSPPIEALTRADAVVHLMGEPVAQRWTEAVKAKIRDSRVSSTRQLVAALRELTGEDRPEVLVSQSGVGFYGATGDRELDEHAPGGTGFLADVVAEWEREAQAAESVTRVVRTRTGVVLTPSGGALAKMLPFFRLGIGGPVAGGRQYVPWIHLEDEVAALIFCIDQRSASGPINLSAPNPVPNSELSRALGHALGRPAILPVPGFALRVLYGEMAEIVTTGQRVVPRQLLELGFHFRHVEIGSALEDVLAKRR